MVYSPKSCLTLATPCTVDRQAPLPKGFPRQEYWSGLPFPCPGDLPDPGIKTRSPALQADSLPTKHLLLSHFLMSDSVRPIDASPPGLPVPGTLQARTLERVTISSPMHESDSEVVQSCLTLSDPIDCSLPGSSVHGIFQTSVLEWGAIAFSELSTREAQLYVDCCLNF